MDPVYPVPDGVYVIPREELDLRSDAEVDHDLLHPGLISGEKNIWFFWHSGFNEMPSYIQRNVRNWHRRFSKRGWTIRIIDYTSGSPQNIAKYLDIHDSEVFPVAFANKTINGHYKNQHISDLIRLPILLRYGGVYADVGIMQIGNLDHIWNTTVGNSDSPFEIFSYSSGSDQRLTNYFLASRPNNSFFLRCHKLLLKLWATNGGRTNTDGMHASPLLTGVPLLDTGLSFKEDGKVYGREETARTLTDYVSLGQVIALVMGLVDSEDSWNGPQYVAERIYAYEYLAGSQLVNKLTDWNGRKQFELLSLTIAVDVKRESNDQRLARQIIESSLSKSFSIKLSTGMTVRIIGDTLSCFWKKEEGSDNIPGTYAHWLRYGTLHWCPKDFPLRHKIVIPVLKVGRLLEEGGD